MERNIQHEANVIARRAGFGRATRVLLVPGLAAGRVVLHVPYGYRKYTTGEYVPNNYRSNFGWKNTYYQRAETHVELPRDGVFILRDYHKEGTP